MSEIVPTILTGDATSFNQFVTVYSTFAKRIQLDICDGTFAPVTTVQLNQITLPTNWAGKWDFHMMVSRPSQYVQIITELKPSLAIFHAECEENLLPIFEQLSSAGIKTGVAIMESTYPGSVAQYIEAADHVLIFAGNLGQQGGKADLLQLEKVELIRNIDKNIEIGWDGGANMKNVRSLTQNGIDIINVGSAISSAENSAEAYSALEAESGRQGVNI